LLLAAICNILVLMRPARQILFFLVALFIGGKAVHSSASLSFHENIKKRYGIVAVKAITSDSSAKGHHTNRKKKARYVELVMPQFESISFSYPYPRNYFVGSLNHSIYSSHLENANGKRGPPSA
jgi:hypothetical protein